MTRVPRGDPDALLAWKGARERHPVGGGAEDARPTVRDLRQPADELAREALEALLDSRRQRLLARVLGLEIGVAAAADHEPAVRELLPVVVAVAAVMGTRIEPLAERLRRDHLVAHRRDRAVELGHEP